MFYRDESGDYPIIVSDPDGRFFARPADPDEEYQFPWVVIDVLTTEHVGTGTEHAVGLLVDALNAGESSLEDVGISSMDFQEDFIETAINGYVAALLWSETDEDGQPLDDLYCPSDIASNAMSEISEDVRWFVISNWYDVRGLSASQVGHDFLLTRNRHGAGFWDRGLGELGTRLTNDSHAYGDTYAYVGDDGMVWVL